MKRRGFLSFLGGGAVASVAGVKMASGAPTLALPHEAIVAGRISASAVTAEKIAVGSIYLAKISTLPTVMITDAHIGLLQIGRTNITLGSR